MDDFLLATWQNEHHILCCLVPELLQLSGNGLYSQESEPNGGSCLLCSPPPGWRWGDRVILSQGYFPLGPAQRGIVLGSVSVVSRVPSLAFKVQVECKAVHGV